MRKKNAESIGEALRQFLSENKVVMQKLGESRIESSWAELMGPTVASYTTNLYIRNSVLFVQVSSAALRAELLIDRHRLLKRLNDHAGIDVLTDVVIR